MKLVVLDPETEVRFRADWANPRRPMKLLEARYGHTRDTLRRVAAELGLTERRDDPWTDDLTAEIIRRYVAGDGAADLAREKGLTRNQVVSKLSREGVLRRREEIIRPVRPEKPARPQPAARQPVAPPPVEPSIVIDFVPRAPVGRKACLWPIGDPALPGYSTCGAAAEGPYCGTHRKVAYQPTVAKKKTIDPFVMPVRARFS